VIEVSPPRDVVMLSAENNCLIRDSLYRKPVRPIGSTFSFTVIFIYFYASFEVVMAYLVIPILLNYHIK
jgi:hypothetical protein